MSHGLSAVEGPASALLAADWSGWRLLKVGMAVAISSNETAVKFAASVGTFFPK